MTKRIIDESVKNDFKFLRDNPNITYLNSSSTSLKLDAVVEKFMDIYMNRETTLGRSTIETGDLNKKDVEDSFKTVAKHINAKSEDLMLIYGTTYGINRIAYKILLTLEDGDEVFLGEMEHSANIITWIKIAEELNKKISFRWYPLTDKFEIDYDKLKEMVTDKTKVIAAAHVYNTVGTKNDLNKIREAVGEDVIVFIDGAQAISHCKIDVTEGNIDYYVFGGHKGFAPYGVGFAYIKNLYEVGEPYQYGGGIEITYTKDNVVYKEGKAKYLAGTIDVPGVIAFKTAIDYIESFGVEQIEKYNADLKAYAEERIKEIPNIRVINEGLESPNLFFEVKGVAGEDVGYHLGKWNISVRTGAACVKITNGAYEPYKAIRASFHIYNTRKDIDILIEALKTGGDFLEGLFNKRPTSEICK